MVNENMRKGIAGFDPRSKLLFGTSTLAFLISNFPALPMPKRLLALFD